MGGHSSHFFFFFGKHKIDPKIIIFVLLHAIVSQKGNNAIASVRSPLAIYAYLDEKCPSRERLCSVRSAYFDALLRLQTREADAQTTLKSMGLNDMMPDEPSQIQTEEDNSFLSFNSTTID